jgi:ribosomal protein L11 methyltransferase
MLYAELDAFEPVAIQEHDTGDGWRVFFRTAALRDAARGALASEFGNALLELTPLDVDDEDWARRSQASLKAVRVGRIVVAPPWEVTPTRDQRFAISDSPDNGAVNPGTASREPRTASRDILVVIDPSMGFGTGHHATTRLCLELLQRIDVRNRRVIDVGTGSGVLALAARALGASTVTALDNDPDALQNARENIARNAADAIEIVEGDLSSAMLGPADVVLANLTGAVLQRHAAALRRLIVDAGILIVSGFSGDEVDELAVAFDVQPQEVLIEGEWAAARFGRRSAALP